MAEKDLRTEVYSNGHCQVVVTIHPNYYQEKGLPLALTTIDIFTKDRQGSVWGRMISPWNQRITKGRLWWKKVVKILTPEDQFEQAIIEAVTFADNYRFDYLKGIQDVNSRLEGATYTLEAMKELAQVKGAHSNG